MADRPPPSTAAIAIATAIIGAVGGYFVGQASSLGVFGAKSRRPHAAAHSRADDDSSSDEPDADDDDDQQAGDLQDFAGSKEECKLVLVVRTDLGMTKGKLAAPLRQRQACWLRSNMANFSVIRQNRGTSISRDFSLLQGHEACTGSGQASGKMGTNGSGKGCIAGKERRGT